MIVIGLCSRGPGEPRKLNPLTAPW